VRQQLGDGGALLVMSDHGCRSFRRQVHLNAWLRQAGYLAVDAKRQDQDMLEAVDWPNTRAYALGFGGVYLNLAGREARGIVAPGVQAEALKEELAAGLRALRDGGEACAPVARVYDRAEVYQGPYLDEAPDLIVGLRPGYRVAWNTVTGSVGEQVFSDNTRPWRGDHSVDPQYVPGVLFCDRRLEADSYRIVDIAPTVLDLLGVDAPRYMDGRSLLTQSEDAH